MLKVTFFMNLPNGKPWKHFKKMMPRLGAKYDIDIETIAKTKADYMTDEYFELDLPVAPAVMVGEEIVVEGSDVSEEKLESAIRKYLWAVPSADHGFLGKIFVKKLEEKPKDGKRAVFHKSGNTYNGCNFMRSGSFLPAALGQVEGKIRIPHHLSFWSGGGKRIEYAAETLFRF